MSSHPPLELPLRPEALKQLAADYARALADPQLEYAGWCRELVPYLERVANAGMEERSSQALQEELFNAETISKTGLGNVKLEAALADSAFRDWLAASSLEPLPSGADAQSAQLTRLYEEIQRRLISYGTRTPRLKLFRAMAALYPRHFTTVADIDRLGVLHKAMFGHNKPGQVERHQAVLRRLEEVLGPVEGRMDAWVRRMTLPWFIFQRVTQAVATAPATTDKLEPLPAIRRRRGLTAVGGLAEGAMRALDFVGDGVSPAEFMGFLRQENPRAKESTLKVISNVLHNELDVFERDGDLVMPTELGRQWLQTGDPFVLAPRLVTRILGMDHALVALRDEGPLVPKDLYERLQEANPGWKTNFGPGSILSWLRSFGAVTLDAGKLQLTERGRAWAELVHWVPEALGAPQVKQDGLVPNAVSAEEEELVTVEVPDRRPLVPTLSDIIEKLPSTFGFSREQVATLHAGLWAHPHRHFAILSGLSGSGKTSLAVEYAKAIIALTGGERVSTPRLRMVPVAPGWTDQTALLGYVNPLSRPSEREYVSTAFVELLLSCADHPSLVHVAVLDEMNLSHPEQYLAPVLSGMERADLPFVLHESDGDIDGVPPALPRYPSNLVLIGTVNMDETTHGLSDKVLDRAVTLEFWEIDLAKYPRWGTRGLPVDLESKARELLEELMAVLAPVRLHFGWRVVDDVLDFLSRVVGDGVLSPAEALDGIVHAKILPKLRGHDAKAFRVALAECGAVLERHGLKRSQAKASSLASDLETTGSARFWR